VEQLTEVLIAFVIYCNDQIAIKKKKFCIHDEYKILSCCDYSVSMQKCVSM